MQDAKVEEQNMSKTISDQWYLHSHKVSKVFRIALPPGDHSDPLRQGCSTCSVLQMKKLRSPDLKVTAEIRI